MKKTSLNYQDAGVDINAGEQLVEAIKPIAAKTKRPGVLAGLGGFGALFELPIERYRKPVLVSSTDGVGTKLKLALALKQHRTIGIDLVAMCVNDIIVQGAEPLFFLDYYATGHLSVEIASQVIEGIGRGCERAGVALVGGETAEMPGMYAGEEYDLAGFTVGIVEKDKIIDGSQVRAGDQLIALSASGVHSNGFSLVRKILDIKQINLETKFANSTLGQTLLEPTRIYVKPILELLKIIPIHAMAHITGGGLIENLPRVMPAYTQAIINTNSWQWPDIFTWLQTQGSVETQEMYRTFNCGVGMVICVAADHVENALKLLQQQGEHAWLLGEITTSNIAEPAVIFQ